MQFDIELQSQVGFVLKEIIIQDLPDSIVRKFNNNQYVLLLDIEELSDLNIELSKIFLEKKLARSKEKNDVEKIKEYKERLNSLNNPQVSIDNNEDIKAQIAQLQSQLKTIN